MEPGPEGSRSRSAADRRLGRYELVAEAGETAIGTVFVGRIALGADRGRPVLVRRVEKGADHDDGTLQALREAANEVIAFRHPRVLTGVEARLGTSLVIATGYAEGELLRQLLGAARARAAAITPAVATRLITDLVTTLTSVRDALAEVGLGRPLAGLCPDCVLVDPEGRCHLSDLGLATLQRPPRHAELMAYRAPEQLGPPGEADERSVVFSVAVIWWELLANQSLFGGGSQAAVWQRVRQAAIVPPAAAGVTARALLMRALDRDPARRYASLDDLSAALSGLDAESVASSAEAARTVEALAGDALRARRAALEVGPAAARAPDASTAPAPLVAESPSAAPAAELPRPASFLSLRPTEGVPDEGDWEIGGSGSPSSGGARRGGAAPSSPRPASPATASTGIAPTAPPVASPPTIEPPATVREVPDRRRRVERGAPVVGGLAARPRAAPPVGAVGAGAATRAHPVVVAREAPKPPTPAVALPVPPGVGGAGQPSATPPRPRGSTAPPRPGRRVAEEPGDSTPAPAPPEPTGEDQAHTGPEGAPDSQRDTVEIGIVAAPAAALTPSEAPSLEPLGPVASAAGEPPLASESLAGPVQRPGQSSRPPGPPTVDAAATYEPSAVGLERLAASVLADTEGPADGEVARGNGVALAGALPAAPRRRSLAPLVLVAGGLSFVVAFAVVAVLLARSQTERAAAAPLEVVVASPVESAAAPASATASVTVSPAPSVEAPAPSVPLAPPELPSSSAGVTEPPELPTATAAPRRGGRARPPDTESGSPEPERPAAGDGTAVPRPEPDLPAAEPPPSPGVTAPAPDGPSPYD